VAIIEINCRDVWREISNYIDNDVDAELRKRMEAHFAGCEHCSAILDGTRNVIELVGDGQAFQVPQGFSQRLKTKIESSTQD
jgi:anti-sigma factor RsiW